MRAPGEGITVQRRSWGGCCGLAAALAVMGSASVVSGQATDGDRREDEARRECLAGRTQRGLDLLAELFTETKDANYIFNQARCFQQNNRPDEAIGRFREYLRKASELSPAERAEVEAHIADCEVMKGGGQRPAVGVVVPPPDPALRDQMEQGDRGRAARLRTVGLATAAAGVVAVGFGAAMGIKTRSLETQFEERRAKDPRYYDRQAYNEGQRAEVLQWVGYAVGAVAMGTGAIFYYLGSRERPTSGAASIAWVPVVSGRQVGAQVGWRF